jgi:hypothetical protein
LLPFLAFLKKNNEEELITSLLPNNPEEPSGWDWSGWFKKVLQLRPQAIPD